MNGETWQVVLNLLLGGFIVGLLDILFIRIPAGKRDVKRSDIDRLSAAQDQLEEVISSLKCRIDELQADNTNLRARVRELEEKLLEYINGAQLLIQQIASTGHTPVWTPQGQGETPIPNPKKRESYL